MDRASASAGPDRSGRTEQGAAAPPPRSGPAARARRQERRYHERGARAIHARVRLAAGIGPSGPPGRTDGLSPVAARMPSVLAMTASTVRLVRVCFSCLMCGLDTPNIEVRIDDLSRVAVRRALAGVVSDLGPIWAESLIPHCPRCR